MALIEAAAVLLFLYIAGFAVGSLFLDGRDSLSWSVIRVVAGLLVTTLGFLLALVLAIPWFLGAAAALLIAVLCRRTDAWRPPRARAAFTRDGAAAALLSAVILSPIALAAWRMAPGDFAPVFFSVDSAYSLEKVQALASATSYPPPSLSNLGGTRTYHYATQAMAALVARATGVPPHRALFGVVIPLLIAGVAAAAAAAARGVAPLVPAWISVPILLVPVPSFWYPFSEELLVRVPLAADAGFTAAVDGLFDNYEMWGVATVEAHNVGASFVVLAVVAAIAAGVSRGHALAVFLIGSAILIKTSAGIALVAGFMLAEAYRVASSPRLAAIWPAAAAAAVFAFTYLVFFVAPGTPADFETRLFPLFHISTLMNRTGTQGLAGLALDVGWLMLPAILLRAASRGAPSGRSVALLLIGLAPFIVVNTTRAVDVREAGGGSTEDWIQILVTAPIVLHAFVLSFANERWPGLTGGTRCAFMLVLAAAILPLVWVAGAYARVLVEHPEDGHEYVDNRSIGDALRVIPTDGTVIVTNDLRYPANGFSRTDRQMQIPALFGHQAFAVNYRYERYEFSARRAEVQKLLEAPAWSPELDDAADTHGWTHLLIRKDYPHPESIPLDRVFENDDYVVFRWSRR